MQTPKTTIAPPPPPASPKSPVPPPVKKEIVPPVVKDQPVMQKSPGGKKFIFGGIGIVAVGINYLFRSFQ